MTMFRAITGLSIWLAVSVSLWITNSRPAVFVLAGVVALGVALVGTLIDSTRATVDTGWSRLDVRDPPTASDPWTIQTRHQLSAARTSGSTELRDRLVALVNDRRDVGQPLTPVLDDLVTGSPKRLGSWRTLEQTISEIEAL